MKLFIITNAILIFVMFIIQYMNIFGIKCVIYGYDMLVMYDIYHIYVLYAYNYVYNV